jgi:dihydrofolate synthase/folylpolyglutamate synthase
MEPIAWLYGLQHYGIKLGLDNIRALLALLGDPQASYPSLLVGGTNGKGSVAAMAHALLGAARIEAGLYTSPHLVQPTERIRIGDADIDLDELRDRLDRVRRTIESALAAGRLAAHPTFFEVMTATALEAFRDHGLPAAVLEVGLGGRLDATNAVAAAISVVVNVDIDHTEQLGSTLASIAREKAGIVKPGRPLVSGAVRQQALSVLQSTCARERSPFVDARLAVRLVAEEGPTVSLQSARGLYENIELALAGRHQIDNARVALAAYELFAEVLGHAPQPQEVRAGLAATRWPGRLQWIRRAGAPDLLLDGAHNPAAIAVLVRTLQGLQRPKPVTLFGAMQDKPLQPMLESLVRASGTLVLTRPSLARAAQPAALARIAGSLAQPCEVVEEPAAALARARQLAAPGQFVLVTGSLYLVGEILALCEGRNAPGPIGM